MNLYLDDDSADGVLIRLLQADGHDVLTPAQGGLSGAADARHFAFAIAKRRIILTRNYDDFSDLHSLVIAADGHHPGVFFVRFENNPRRDMSPRGIAGAVRKISRAQVELFDRVHFLNDWR